MIMNILSSFLFNALLVLFQHVVSQTCKSRWLGAICGEYRWVFHYFRKDNTTKFLLKMFL